MNRELRIVNRKSSAGRVVQAPPYYRRSLAPNRYAATLVFDWRMKALLIVWLVLFLAPGCTDQGTSYEGVFLGEFAFTAIDTIGTLYRSGAVGMYQNDLTITGYWKSGPNSGNLEGRLRREEIVLNLNPQFQDNNFFMVGTIAGNTFSGRWQHFGVGGLMAQGTFTGSRL